MHRTFSKLAIVGAAFAVIVGITVLITGQPASKLSRQPASPHHVGVVNDWSFHHLVFSNPGTYEQAIAKGTYSKWINIQYDTRFILQQMRRSSGVKTVTDPGTGGKVAVPPSGMVEPEDLAIGGLRQLRGGPIGPSRPKPTPKPRPKPTTLKRDWAVPLLTGTVQPNAYPATWGASGTTASCANDFAVYPTGSAGTETAANIIAYNELYGTTTTGCSHTPTPAVYWAYETAGNDTGATVTTSPIISLDGSQVAYIQTDATTATLVLLKWGPTGNGTLTAPGCTTRGSPNPCTQGGLAYANSTSYRGTAGPVYTSLVFGGSYQDTYSQPFYDYDDDALYVGDDDGRLHQFTGVFNGTPTESGSPWPVLLNLGIKLTSPVYDQDSGYVFVGDMGGILHAVGTGNAGTTSGSIHGTSSSLGDVIIDGPLVDPSAGSVYVFVTTNSGGNNAVFQFSTTFTTGTGNGAATGTTVGTGGTGYYLYAGTFDNVYFQTSTPPEGNLWVLGNTGIAGGALYQIPITHSTGLMGTAVSVVTVNDGRVPWESPLTEFCNNGLSACSTDGTNTTAGADYLFFSVQHSKTCTNGDGYGDGCVVSYNISNSSSVSQAGVGLYITSVSGSASSPAGGCWGTGGIVIDNSVPSGTLAGASQIYFIDLGSSSVIAGHGNTAGGPGGATSSACDTESGNTIQAVQASQSSP